MSQPITASEDFRIISEVLAPWRGKLEKVALFGSRATGKSRPNSDYDIVLYGNLAQADIDRIWTLFSESPLAVSVDLIAYNLIRHAPLKAHIDLVALDIALD